MSRASLRVLLVEDDKTVSRAAERYLTHRGHELVAVAYDCRQALAEERRFDCALLDIDLPDGSGVDVARQLLERRSTPVVLFFSGTESEDDRLAASELGTFVNKAAGLHALVNAMEAAVEEIAAEAIAVNGEGSTAREDNPRLRSGLRRTR